MGIAQGHVLLLLAGFVPGCGGNVLLVDGGTRGSRDAGSSPSEGTPPGTSQGDDAGAGASGFPVCPPGAPQVGAACTLPPTNGCAYVSAGSCQAFVCGAAGQWQVATGGC